MRERRRGNRNRLVMNNRNGGKRKWEREKQ